MSTKTHPNFKFEVNHRGETVKVKTSMRECPQCPKRCGHCNWPFTLSTALDYDMIFCSEECRKGGIPYDSPPPKRGSLGSRPRVEVVARATTFMGHSQTQYYVVNKPQAKRGRYYD